MTTVKILNGRFHPLTLEQSVEEMAACIRRGDRGYLCTVNVAILMMMREDARLQRFVDEARWVVADGQPLIWTAPLVDRPLPERVAGVDLVDALCDRAQREGFGVYFLGATRPLVEAAVERMTEKFPRLDIRGYADGYFDAQQAPERARAVAESGAHVLFVGMGVPRQERFIEEQWGRLGVNVAVGVGGSFDVLAGLRSRAPAALQRVGMEWAYRLAQEPRRLFKRYLTTNSQFLYLVSRELLRSTSRGSPSRR